MIKKSLTIIFILGLCATIFSQVSGPSNPTANSIAVFVGPKKITNSVVTISESGQITIPDTGTSYFNNLSATNLIFSGVLNSDDIYTGNVINGLNAGETLSQWDIVRIHTDGEWHQADANAAGEFPARGIAVSTGVDGGNLIVLVCGTVRNDAWNWTIGGTLYLSTTAGELTQTAPSTTGECIQIVGFAISADLAYFNFSGHYTLAP